jgi:hypothetical protein
MGYALFAVSAYILMRATEVLLADKRDEMWYKWAIRIIACGVIYTSVASMLWFYFEGLHLLGFDPK